MKNKNIIIGILIIVISALYCCDIKFKKVSANSSINEVDLNRIEYTVVRVRGMEYAIFYNDISNAGSGCSAVNLTKDKLICDFYKNEIVR